MLKHQPVAWLMSNFSFSFLEEFSAIIGASIAVPLVSGLIIAPVLDSKYIIDLAVSYVSNIGIPLLVIYVIIIPLLILANPSVGKYTKLSLDFKNRSIGYHIQRNLADLQLSEFEIGRIKNIPAYENTSREAIIQWKNNELKKDIMETLRELIGEIKKAKIRQFDSIVLDSYLLMNNEMYVSMEKNLKEKFPEVTVSKTKIRTNNKFIQIALRVQDKKINMIRNNSPRVNWHQKILSKIACSENLGYRVIAGCMTYPMTFISYFSKSKKDFKYTRGIIMKLP